MKTKLLLLSASIFLCLSIFSQSITPEVFATSGDYFISGNSALSWTMGEAIVETYPVSNNILSQGFQQPYYLTTRLSENLSGSISVTIYPNPSENYLTINFSSETLSPLTMEVFDLTGKLLLKKLLPSKTLKSEIDISQLAAAIYFLKINSAEQNIFNTYKIQKIY